MDSPGGKGSFKRRQDSFKRRQARLIRMRTLQSGTSSASSAGGAPAAALNHQSSSVLKSSPSSSEDPLTSLRPDLPLKKQFTPQPGVPTVDRFLSHLGNPGRYQVIIMMLLAANCIPVVVNHLLMAFYAVETPHNCRVPKDAIERYDTRDKSLWLPHIASKTNGSNSVTKWSPTPYAQCEIYKDPYNHSLGTEPCVEGYEFHMEGNEWNVISEWGLVCDREFVGALISSTYFCGVMVGGIIFGYFSDKFGRKNIMLICLYTQCVIGIALHFVRRLVVFMGLRCIQGIFIQGLQCVTYSMVMELFSRKYRAMAGCIIEAFWAFGVILLALIARYVQHWRYIQLAINIPTLATIFYIWIVPESVRWLLSRGKFTRAEAIVGIIASNNSLKLDPIWLREEMEEVGRIVVLQVPDKYPDIRDLMKHKGIRKHALVLFFVWFAVSLSYYGISYSIPDLSGDRYLNFMIGGGIELAAYLLAFVVINAFGRKVPLMFYLTLSGILCISVVCIRHYLSKEVINVESLATALALIGKATIVSCFCIIFIYTSEVFPTVIRTVGVGTCAFWARVGSLLAPQIRLLGKKLLPAATNVVPFITFGGLSVLAALLVMILPETGEEDLPDTVREAENLGEERCRMAKQEYDDNTLVRSEDCTQTQYSEGEEAGYGKSPEWVEVDGMIVSRGGAMLHMTSALNSLHNSTTGSRSMHAKSHGSVLSLPYSSRTLLTYNSTSSTQRSSGRSTTETLDRVREPDYEEEGDSDPPYETIPSVPPSINIIENYVTTEAKVEPPSLSNNSKKSVVTHHDESVISAHDVHTGIYDIISKLPPSSNSNNVSTKAMTHNNPAVVDKNAAVQGYFIRKKLLMQDANETRL